MNASDSMNDSEAGRLLAERHKALAPRGGARVAADRSRSLLNFSEVAYDDDWSLRSALCRLAQPEPVRVGRVLESTRRLEVVLHHAQRALERHGAYCLRPASRLAGAVIDPPPEASGHYPGVRTADLARMVESGFAADSLVSSYAAVEGIEPLGEEERVAIPLLGVAVRFEDLAATLTAWAAQGSTNRPVEAFDQACDEIESRLDALGVPRETGGPPRRGRSRRSS